MSMVSTFEAIALCEYHPIYRYIDTGGTHKHFFTEGNYQSPDVRVFVILKAYVLFPRFSLRQIESAWQWLAVDIVDLMEDGDNFYRVDTLGHNFALYYECDNIEEHPIFAPYGECLTRKDKRGIRQEVSRLLAGHDLMKDQQDVESLMVD